MALIQPIDGPIPGENFTSNTKNYPWHRPPEFTDIDDAIEYTIKKFRKKEAAFGLITMIEMGMDISTLTRTYVVNGIGQGRWTPDFAILLAGPVARIMMLMAKSYGVEYDLGIDDSLPPTKVFLDFVGKVSPQRAVEAAESVEATDVAAPTEEPAGEAPTPSTGGFMSRPTPVPIADTPGV